jgi:hypothetical protein
MGVDKIVKLVGVIVAIVAGVMSGFPYSGLLIVLLGIAGAWFIPEDDPVVGGWIDGALGGLSDLFNAAAGTAIVLGLVERLKP